LQSGDLKKNSAEEHVLLPNVLYSEIISQHLTFIATSKNCVLYINEMWGREWEEEPRDSTI